MNSFKITIKFNLAKESVYDVWDELNAMKQCLRHVDIELLETFVPSKRLSSDGR
jgi:hypothetical protein